MSFTFLNAQEKLSRLLGDPNSGTDDQWPVADRKKELNRGELQFAKDTGLLREYATSTISSMAASVPSDWLETTAFYIINSSKYIRIDNDREISVKDLERHGDYGGDLPFFYLWELSGTRKMNFLGSTGNNGRTYKWFYKKKPTTELSADADVSLFPEEFREGPVYYAAAELLRQIGKTDQSNDYMAVYAKFVRDGLALAEKLYPEYEQPRPDFNIADTTIQDRQGGGVPVGG